MAEYKCQRLRVEGIQANMCEDIKEEDDETPEEVSKTKQLFQDYFVSFFVSMAVGLYCLLHMPESAKALKSTSASDNPLRAFLRYHDTLLHVIRWFDSPTSRQSSLKTVRIMHRNA